jgi:hypothetical protein
VSKLIDITGQTFGAWTVIERGTSPTTSKNGAAYWRCRCACGRIRNIRGSSLRSGGTNGCAECGLYLASLRNNHLPEDLTGLVFNTRTVIGPVLFSDGNPTTNWLVRCTCGREAQVSTRTLRSSKGTRCVACSLKRRSARQQKDKASGR